MADRLSALLIVLFGGLITTASAVDWLTSNHPRWFFVGFGLLTIALGTSWLRQGRESQ